MSTTTPAPTPKPAMTPRSTLYINAQPPSSHPTYPFPSLPSLQRPSQAANYKCKCKCKSKSKSKSESHKIQPHAPRSFPPLRSHSHSHSQPHRQNPITAHSSPAPAPALAALALPLPALGGYVFPSRSTWGVQSQRAASGTVSSTEGMCWPQPIQLDFLHVSHVAALHILT